MKIYKDTGQYYKNHLQQALAEGWKIVNETDEYTELEKEEIK